MRAIEAEMAALVHPAVQVSPATTTHPSTSAVCIHSVGRDKAREAIQPGHEADKSHFSAGTEHVQIPSSSSTGVKSVEETRLRLNMHSSVEEMHTHLASGHRMTKFCHSSGIAVM